MGRRLIVLFGLLLSITISSAYHRYHHYKPRDVYDEYHDTDGEEHHIAEEQPDPLHNDEPNANEELNIPDPAYDVPNFEIPDVKEIQDNGRANAPVNGYEVTEDVDDIPNPIEYRPIVANYSTARPLNFAGLNKTNSKIVEEKKNKRNSLEHTHEDLYSFTDFFPEVKESIDGVKNSFVNELKGFKVEVLKKVNEPVTFLHKLHKKANDVFRNVNKWFDYNHSYHSDDDDDDFETF